MIRFLISVALGCVALASATSEAAARDASGWQRSKHGGHAVDAPAGWRVAMDDAGGVQMRAQVRGYGDAGKLREFRLAIKQWRVDEGTSLGEHALALLAELDDRVEPMSTTSGDGYFALVAPTWSNRRIGIRLQRDPGNAHLVTVGVVEAHRAHFSSGASLSAWAVLDRAIVSRTADTTGTAPTATWKYKQHRSSSWAVHVPAQWTVKDSPEALLAYELEGKGLARHVVMATSTDAPYERAVDTGVLAALRRLAGSTATVTELVPRPRDLGTEFDGLYSFTKDGVEHRAAALVIPWGTGAQIVVAVSEADDFWRIDPRAAARVLLRDRGIPEGAKQTHPLVGTWQTGAASNLFEHYDASGGFTGTSYRGVGMRVRFGAKGDYQMIYLYRNNHGLESQTYSKETGRYSFDGFTLTLTPEVRVVQTDIDGKSKTEQFKRGLPRASLAVSPTPVATTVGISGAGVEWLGMTPRFQRMRRDNRTLAFSRVVPRPSTARGKPGFGKRKRKR